ncbi:MAG: hypothetical protein K6G29_08155 [Clostridiales bacterium]|nr:hypothetical protein [Clostridiales bacterium]
MKQPMNAPRVLCLLLAAVLVLSSVSCAKNDTGDTPDPNTAAVAQSDAQNAVPDAEPAETEPPKPLAYLGEHDFEGRTYTVLVSGMDNSEWRQNNIDADAENPEIINSSRFNRNIEVEDTLNVTLASIEQFGNGGIVMGELKAAVKADDEIYNSVQLCCTDAAKITLEGYFVDLMTLPGLSLSEPWWDARSVEDMTIRGQLYHAVNAVCIASYNATFAILFNKELAADYQLESPYQDVLDGKWTYDALSGMMTGVSTDLDGNGKMDDHDLFGLCLWVDAITGAVNSGLEYCAQVGEDGLLALTLDTERVQDIVDKFISFAADPAITADYIYKGYSSYDLFAGNHALFYMQEINRITAFRDMESDFGVLPMPKFNEEQPVYRSCVAENDGVLLSVPIVISDAEFTGIVLDALACLSERYVMPAYYEITLQRKAARDEESGQMLDIIFSTRAYDLGWIYQVGALKNSMKDIVQGASPNISALVQKRKSIAGRMINTVNEFYENGN